MSETALFPMPWYSQGGIDLYLGDCREVLPRLPRQSVDMVLTDPPYGMKRFATDGKDYLLAVAPALREAWEVLKEGGSMFVFASPWEAVKVAAAVGLPVRRLFWMYKPGDCAYPHHGWISKSETIIWFVKGERPVLAERKPYSHDCYVVNRVGKEGVEGHPTVKPLSVVSDLASRCPEGGLILDPFAGSGTTLRAAKDLGRRAIGVEIEQKYCELVVGRMAQGVLPLGGKP